MSVLICSCVCDLAVLRISTARLALLSHMMGACSTGAAWPNAISTLFVVCKETLLTTIAVQRQTLVPMDRESENYY